MLRFLLGGLVLGIPVEELLTCINVEQETWIVLAGRSYCLFLSSKWHERCLLIKKIFVVAAVLLTSK